MCLICIEFQKKALTIPEALRNLKEMQASIGDAHAEEVRCMVQEKAAQELDELLAEFRPWVRPPECPADFGSNDGLLETEFDDIPFCSW